jgi:NADH-quinone oxidoreductase subunit F
VATFYALLSTRPRPPAVAHVCDDIACRLAGAEELCERLDAALGPEGESWSRSPCLGLCDRAPAAFVAITGTDERRVSLAPATVAAIEASLAGPPGRPVDDTPLAVPVPDAPLSLLRRVGRVDPTSLDAYRAADGYVALTRALRVGREQVIDEVTASGLVGRGGAAFPTGRKWAAVAAAPAAPHYLVCNADESEPGTFKDRVLLEGDPFAIVEAMTIAGFAVGAERGFLYIRGEYPLAEARVTGALAQARAAGLLGAGIAGTDTTFDIELRRGAGAYICGEETALFASIEGRRGEPRNKPPFPVEVGLFGRPTAVNNVETLASIPLIVGADDGAASYAAIGSGTSRGPKLFCVSGHVQRPGVYEVPFGATLGQLIDRAGGVAGGRSIRAVLLGGAAGVFVGPEALATPLTFEGIRTIGATLGSGVVMVFDERADLLDTIRRIAAFFRDESCGQCVPCRVGTVRQEEVLARLLRDRGSAPDRDGQLVLLRELGQVMRDASICGLGQTASSAIESAFSRPGMMAP